MKTLDELVNVESSWPLVQELLSQAKNKVEVLPAEPDKAKKELVALGQSLKSLMGAVTYNTGGILIDGGWLRILGSGHETMTRTISNWNLGRSCDGPEQEATFLMVADDILGGIFAVNGGELGEDIGSMYYLSPDSAFWEQLEISYHEFLAFCIIGDIDQFYSNVRWKGWEEEVAKLSGDQAFMIAPPLWAEGPADLGERERIVIPMDESYEMTLDTNNMLADMEDMQEHDHDCCGEHDHDHDCCGEHDHDHDCCGEHEHGDDCCGGGRHNKD